ncbi:unnamed protein product, partial [Mesorhabditis belari]|uniref:Biogenesis of lysosome-related organelles complex 1 subunit 7 n=1 Tax=Mesorhabditis belari TaxID=2138241 RepID=A0AAF3JB48_9BILA
MDSSVSYASSGESVSIDSNKLALVAVAPALEALDNQILATRESQKLLNHNVDKMAEFLRQLNESEEPYDLISYEMKLADCKKRISSSANHLGEIHDRLSRLQRLIAREIYKKKSSIKGQAPLTPPSQ